jgi:hypothetical protein
MKSLQEYQKAFAEAAKKKFDTYDMWDTKDRVLSVQRQLADVSGGLQKEEGIFPHLNKAYDNPDHRIAASIADLLILVDMRGFDIEKELEEVLKWYRKPLDS